MATSAFNLGGNGIGNKPKVRVSTNCGGNRIACNGTAILSVVIPDDIKKCKISITGSIGGAETAGMDIIRGSTQLVSFTGNGGTSRTVTVDDATAGETFHVRMISGGYYGAQYCYAEASIY